MKNRVLTPLVAVTAAMSLNSCAKPAIIDAERAADRTDARAYELGLKPDCLVALRGLQNLVGVGESSPVVTSNCAENPEAVPSIIPLMEKERPVRDRWEKLVNVAWNLSAVGFIVSVPVAAVGYIRYTRKQARRFWR